MGAQMIRLEDVLTDEEIRYEYTRTTAFYKAIRACIALAVEKWPEKVSGFVSDTMKANDQTGCYFNVGAINRLDSGYRHALLLLGPRFEAPKPEPRSYGKHAPTECDEVLGHEWHRTFKCPTCLTTYYEPAEEMRETDSLQCYGDGTRVLSEG